MFTDFKATDLIWVAVYIVAAFPIIRKAVRNIRHGEIFDENFLMMVASFGALLLGEYLEGIAVMALYRIGEYLQDRRWTSPAAPSRALWTYAPTMPIWSRTESWCR